MGRTWVYLRWRWPFAPAEEKQTPAEADASSERKTNTRNPHAPDGNLKADIILSPTGRERERNGISFETQTRLSCWNVHCRIPEVILSPFQGLLYTDLCSWPRQKVLNADGSSRRWERSLHNSSHKRLDQRGGNGSSLLYLIQDLNQTHISMHIMYDLFDVVNLQFFKSLFHFIILL